jgi:hypothetical protein
MNPNIINWEEDGIFQALAKSLGIKDYQSAVNILIDIVRNCNNETDFEKIGERMWSNGHPLKFTGVHSK